MDNVVLVRSSKECKEILEKFQRVSMTNQAFPEVKVPYSLLITSQRSNEVKEVLKALPHDRRLLELIVTNVRGKLSLQNIFHGQYPSISKLAFINTGLEMLPETLHKHFPNVKDLILTNNAIKTVPDCVGNLASLQSLQISRNHLINLPTTVGQLRNLKGLYCAHNKLTTLPATLSDLSGLLERVDVSHNSINTLPTAIVSCVRQLRAFYCFNNPLSNQLSSVKEDIVRYLEELREGIALNNRVKLVVVGEESAGKSTLVRALRSKDGVCRDPVKKTDGIDIDTLKIKGIEFEIFDTAGDADFLETHLLFTSPNCLYLNVFNLAALGIEGETGSQLGRLQMWLNSIYTRAPNSRNLIVGTHADDVKYHYFMKEDIEKRLKAILEEAREPHQQRFQEERVEDCFVCLDNFQFEMKTKHTKHKKSRQAKNDPQGDQPINIEEEESDPYNEVHGEAGSQSNGKSSEIANIPHVVGFHGVSSTKKYPFRPFGKNESIDKLKQALVIQAKEIIEKFPKTPEKWMDVRDNLARFSAQKETVPVISVEEVKRRGIQHGVTDEAKFSLMLRLFSNTGNIIYHEKVSDDVILDPQWLAKQLCTLITFRENNYFEDGTLMVVKLKELWQHIPEQHHEQILKLFRHFNICFPIDETRELFPCRLPLGMPSPSLWPPVPKKEERQVSYMYQFSFIPNVFFPDLVVKVKENKKIAVQPIPRFFCNRIIYDTEEDTEEEPENSGDCKAGILGYRGKHRVHIELIHPKKAVMVTVRGSTPRCIARRLCSNIKGTAGQNVTVQEHLLCPECVVQMEDRPSILQTNQSDPLSCDVGHVVGPASDVLKGKLLPRVKPPREVKCEEVEDKHCPRLFVMLPVNKEVLSYFEYIQYTILKDGFAVHVLCEQPDECHFLSTPGFPLRSVKNFNDAYGPRAYKLLEKIAKKEVPETTFNSICHSQHRTEGRAGLQELLDSYRTKFPIVERKAASINLDEPTFAEDLKRSQLKKLLNISNDNGYQHSFPALYATPLNNKILWLCLKHHEKIVSVEKKGVRMAKENIVTAEARDLSQIPTATPDASAVHTDLSRTRDSQVNTNIYYQYILYF